MNILFVITVDINAVGVAIVLCVWLVDCTMFTELLPETVGVDAIAQYSVLLTVYTENNNSKTMKVNAVN